MSIRKGSSRVGKRKKRIDPTTKTKTKKFDLSDVQLSKKFNEENQKRKLLAEGLENINFDEGQAGRYRGAVIINKGRGKLLKIITRNGAGNSEFMAEENNYLVSLKGFEHSEVDDHDPTFIYFYYKL